MKIFLNGESVECEEECTIEQLLQRHRLAPATTLVERNGVALHRRDWPNEKLREKDQVELLQVAAGG